jgi:TatD DNase family protein
MDTPYINIHTHRRTGGGIEITNYELRITNYERSEAITDGGPSVPRSGAEDKADGGNYELQITNVSSTERSLSRTRQRRELSPKAVEASCEGGNYELRVDDKPRSIEMVSVMAGREAREAAGRAASAGDARAAALAGTASVTGELPAPPFSVGVHPWQSGADGFDLAAALLEVETAPAAAIGEIGLDFAPSVAGDHGGQKMVFAAQLRIAEERRLPVILHCVRAFEPVMEILSAHTLPGVIFHGFVGSPEQAARAVRAGYWLSFGERSLNSPKTVEAMRAVPLEKIFLETDDSPTPIAEIYSRAADIVAVPVAKLKKQLYDNYSRIFRNYLPREMPPPACGEGSLRCRVRDRLRPVDETLSPSQDASTALGDGSLRCRVRDRLRSVDETFVIRNS